MAGEANMKRIFRRIAGVLAFVLMAAGSVHAKTQNQAVIAAAYARPGIDLSGSWAYSVDPYRDGQSGFHGAPASGTACRYVDLDVQKAMAANPKLFYEFDFDRAPRTELPGAWNATDPQFRYFDGLMWYQRHFDFAPKPATRTFVRVEAANYKSFVYLNGEKVGEHEGGFTPFTLEVTGLIRTGDNRITLGVDSEHTDKTVPPTVTDWDIYGGVTRPVRVISVPQTFIDDQFVRLGDDGRIKAVVRLNGPAAAGTKVSLAIPALKFSAETITGNNGEAHFDLKAPKGLKLWSPASPAIYEVTFSAGDDTLSDRIGFRTIKVAGDKLLLNGKPIYLRGISLHEEEIGANPARRMTEANIRALFHEIKDGLHGNFVRLAHYPHSDLATRLADEMGLMVWSEIPVYWRVDFADPQILALAEAMQRENIERDRNRASIVVWSVANETPVSDARNAFLTHLAEAARALDPSRPVSAALLATRKLEGGKVVFTIDDPMAERLDILAVNTYNGWYSEDDLSALPDFAWASPVKKPLIFSEFGADAKIGYHNADNSKFTEEFQAQYYRQTLAMADKVPFVVGMSPWILKDFRSPRRQHPVFQQGWNRKGLISETGERKAAFKVLADYYAQKAKSH
jgi:beta-glucuronidase